MNRTGSALCHLETTAEQPLGTFDVLLWSLKLYRTRMSTDAAVLKSVGKGSFLTAVLLPVNHPDTTYYLVARRSKQLIRTSTCLAYGLW